VPDPSTCPNEKDLATSRRKHLAEQVEQAVQPVSQPISQAPEILRRGLLGMATALIVARPLLPGEDAGRLFPTTGAGDLVITLLWLLAAVGWAIWRAWFAPKPCRVSRVELGLLALGTIFFLSSSLAAATHTAYGHPAWLISSEWLAILAAFWLIRQLPQSDEENAALIAAVLATAVCLSAQGVYQAIRPPVLPRIDPTLAHIYALDLDVPSGPAPDRRLIRATFADSGVFAGFLTLTAPALLLGCWLVMRQTSRPRWQVVLTCGSAGLVFLALGMAQWWPAVVGLLAVGGGVVFIHRHRIPQRVVVGSLAGGIAVVVLLCATLWYRDFVAVGNSRSEYAGNTFSMLARSWFLGIAPGNFARRYPGVVDSPAVEQVSQPSNFLLETLAAGGLIALAALFVTLIAFFRRVWPEVRDAFLSEPEAAADECASPKTRWEFYIGGVFGLTIVFVLQMGQSTRAELLHQMILVSVRSLIWFGAFALLAEIPWTARLRATGLTAGVTALLLCLLVTGGFFYPSLAQPLWIMAALAINTIPETTGEIRFGRAGLMLPVPALAVVWWLYLLLAFLPVVGAARSAREARAAYGTWREKVMPDWLQAMATGTDGRAEYQAAMKARTFLLRHVLLPLAQAVQSDPSDSGLRSELAYWSGKSWEMFARIPDILPTAEAAKMRKIMKDHEDQGVTQLAEAQPLDPYGKSSFWVAYELRMLFGEKRGMKPEEVDNQHRMAANHLRKMIENDPSDPRLRYRIVEVLRPVPDAALAGVWRNEAKRAIVLDDLAKTSQRCLTEQQRQQLQAWLVQPEPAPTSEPADPRHLDPSIDPAK
jgi:hypothetical protein